MMFHVTIVLRYEVNIVGIQQLPSHLRSGRMQHEVLCRAPSQEWGQKLYSFVLLSPSWAHRASWIDLDPLLNEGTVLRTVERRTSRGNSILVNLGIWLSLNVSFAKLLNSSKLWLWLSSMWKWRRGIIVHTFHLYFISCNYKWKKC